MSADAAPFLRGDGEMARRIRAFDWQTTAIGPFAEWPSSLKTITGFLVQCPLPVVLLWGRDGVMLYNDGYAEFAGGRHPTVLGQKVLEGWPEVADFNQHVMDVVLAGGTLAYQDQELTLHRNGRPEQVWMNLDYTPVLGDGGEPEGVIVVVVETTARVKADQRIAAEQARQRELFNRLPGFVAVLSGPTHVFEYVNAAYERIAHRTGFIGKTLPEMFPELAGEGFFEMLDRVYATGEPVTVYNREVRLADQPQYVDFVFDAIRDEAGAVSGVLIGGYEVTSATLAHYALSEREAALRELNATLEKRVQERTRELADNAARVRAMFETGFQYQGLLTTDGLVVDANATSLAAIGCTLGEVRGRPYWEAAWFSATPGLQEQVRHAIPLVAAGGSVRQEVHALLPKLGWRWFDFSMRPVLDADGAVTGIVPEAVDFTDRRLAEEALRQSQKMEAVGQLTGGIAHDFNNLLAGISGSLELMERRLAEGRPGDIGRYIGIAQGSANRAAALTQRLLAFSRRQTLDPKPTDVNRLIAGMEELIRRTVGPSITVEVVGAGGLWLTRIDASQLESALLNLAINARDAMPNGGRMTIETANKWLDAHAAGEREVAPGQYLSICVTDTGTGMTPEVKSRVFDPFFTTKPLGQGTGLGLSMVHGFMRQSGGQVRIYTEVGQGTTMCLYLPRYVGELGDEEPGDASPVATQTASETVLVIDDEDSVRLLMRECLEDMGYHVLAAADGAAGLKILQGPQAIDLLISDVGLPGGINGRQVADAARTLRPALKVLFVTGYAENAVLGHGHLDHGMEVITKPFSLNAFGARVRDILDQP